jgi:hypothetical protein
MRIKQMISLKINSAGNELIVPFAKEFRNDKVLRALESNAVILRRGKHVIYKEFQPSQFHYAIKLTLSENLQKKT